MMRVEPLEVLRQRRVTPQRCPPLPIQRCPHLLIGQTVAPQYPFALLRQRVELRAERGVLGQAQPGLAQRHRRRVLICDRLPRAPRLGHPRRLQHPGADPE
jgi:hypothetical protein